MSRTIKLISLGVIVAVAIIMGSMAVAQILAVTEYAVGSLAEIEDRPEGYILKSRDGYIGVYYRDHGHPIYITNIPLASLRGVDREDIEAGLTVETRIELIKILEDLGS